MSRYVHMRPDMFTGNRMEYSISVPDCDVATLQLALRLLYTGDVQHLVDVADWHRVVNVCTSLGVNLNDFSSSAGNQYAALLLLVSSTNYFHDF